MTLCPCPECRPSRTAPQFRKQRAPRLVEAIGAYLERWQAARIRVADKLIADILGHAREHTAIEVNPRHAMSLSPFAGIDRSTAPSLLDAQPHPLSWDTLREAMSRIIAYQPPQPFKPWIRAERAAQLEADGIAMSTILTVFDIVH